MHRVDYRYELAPRDSSGCPGLHIPHHVNGFELLLFRLVRNDDPQCLVCPPTVKLLEEKLEREKVRVTVIGAAVARVQSRLVDRGLDDGDLKFLKHEDQRFERSEDLRGLLALPTTTPIPNVVCVEVEPCWDLAGVFHCELLQSLS